MSLVQMTVSGGVFILLIVVVRALALAAALVIGTTTAFAVAVQPDAAPDGGASLLGAGTLMDDSTLSSYTDPKDGKNYYSWDGGKTWQPLTDEEFALRFPTPKVVWWTYEEYAAWLEKEKVELQAMLGEKGWTGTRGEFSGPRRSSTRPSPCMSASFRRSRRASCTPNPLTAIPTAC